MFEVGINPFKFGAVWKQLQQSAAHLHQHRGRIRRHIHAPEEFDPGGLDRLA